MRYDLAIVGSGSAAFAAAIRARSSGHSVVMIERGTIGGTCVNSGCVPSKALLAAAEARHVAVAQPFAGIATTAGPVDIAALTGATAELVEHMRAGKYADLAADYGWEILRGQARFAPGPVLEVALTAADAVRVEAGHYLVATGSAPWAPPIDGLEEAGYLTSATAMELDRLPSSLLVIGGNAIGLEQGQLFARLGSRVTVVEALDRLAPFEEPEASAVIEGVFAEEGIGVHTAGQVTQVRRGASGYTLTAITRGGRSRPVELSAEQLLVATGRRPATAGLELETVGVKTGEGGQILVDEFLRTGNPRIWAAGDVTGHPQYVYVAAANGTLAADNALEKAARTLDYATLPRVTFTTPAIAAVGMTDAEALAAGLRCDCRTLPLEHVPRAVVNRDTRGLIKLIAEAGTGRLLGACAVADGAGDIIVAATYALSAGLTVDQLARTWHPYLTMAEGLKLAAQAYTREVTRLSCCAS